MGQQASKQTAADAHFSNAIVSLPLTRLRDQIVTRSSLKSVRCPISTLLRNPASKDRYAIDFIEAVTLDSKPLCPLLRPDILPWFLPFALESLPNLLELSKTWYVVLHDYILRQYCSKLIKDFSKTHAKWLRFETATLSIQALATVTGAIRVDVLMYAEVLNSTANEGWELRYVAEDYQGGREINDFRFASKKKGSSRKVWVRKDLTNFYGGEVQVCSQSPMPEVCVGDFIEIPFTLASGNGAINPWLVRWNPLKRVGCADTVCTLNTVNPTWFERSEFKSRNTEDPPDMNMFAGSLKLKKAEFAGCSVVIARARYEPERLGTVVNDARYLGSRFMIVNKNVPIVVPLQRRGLEHDRLTDSIIRMVCSTLPSPLRVVLPASFSMIPSQYSSFLEGA